MPMWRVFPISGVGLLMAICLYAASVPLAVSPGSPTSVLIGDACPTFSWSAVPGAERYELVIYQIGEEGTEAEPLLRESFTGSAYSWTPSLDRCLERGDRYAWSVRAVSAKGTSEWSSPNLFQVAAGPSEAEFKEALELVRQVLLEEANGSMEAARVSGDHRTGSSPSTSRVSDTVAALASEAGDSDLMVNGSAVVTVASFSSALCSARGLRYLDQGDGTVLDCNTGRIWLKDANCFGVFPYEDGANPNIFDQVTALNNSGRVGATDPGCADYAPGTYTDWEVPSLVDFCSAWEGSFIPLCPSSAASDSLVDSSVGPPMVVNAIGSGVWTEGDAFARVQSGNYWAADNLSAENGGSTTLLTGQAGGSTKSFACHVWPVRGGP